MSEVHSSVAIIDNGSYGKREIKFETGRLARQANGTASVFLDGETMLLSATTAGKSPKDQFDFFPLTVDVEERMYAVGRIPGSFFRREGRPSEDAILTCRLIDRPLRPSFVKGLRNEVQVVVTVMALNPVELYDVIAINAASMSTQLAGLPFSGPIGGVRVALINGQWVAFPTHDQLEDAVFDMVVAGRVVEDDVAIMMVEAEATERTIDLIKGGATAPTEEVVAQGLEAAKPFIRTLCEAQSALAAVAAKEVKEFPIFLDYEGDVYAAVETAIGTELAAALTIAGKQERETELDRVKELCVERVGAQFEGREKEVSAALRSVTKKLIRTRVLKDKIRMDGRGLADIRTLSAEVEVLPRVHGSALFERGETQILGVTTLNMLKLEQQLDTLSPVTVKRYMHNYNFPPYSTGETGRVGSPKRREIGHGALAERALLPVVPSQDEFAYAIRLVSEVLSSNGSTSMASVCSSSLSLMDAGVPLKAPVSGIAMGLIYAEGKYLTLTDILGAEDAFGDMDFKVAGTEDSVTALQLDTKIDGIPADVLAAALQQAREARMDILKSMNAALAAPRSEVSATAPKIVSFTIPLDKVGEVIGPKGKVINTIQQETGADIAVSDDGATGIITIGSPDNFRVEEAKARILAIVDPPTAELNAIYPGRVVSITKFGAFVNILPGRDGLVHISKLGNGQRVNNVEDVLELGQEISVRVEDIDDKGKVSLTPVDADGNDLPGGGGGAGGGERRERRDDRGPREDRGPRNNDRGGRGPREPREPREPRGDSPVEVSFEAEFDSELRSELGDLGPDTRGEDRGDRGPRRRR